MTVVDASVWVSRLVSQDVHHAVSRRWLEQQVARGSVLAAPAILLAEVAGAIARRTGSPELARRAVETLLRVPGLRVVPIDHALGREAAHMAAELRLRGADALYVAVAHHLGVPLITWDREQQERGGGHIVARTPEADQM